MYAETRAKVVTPDGNSEEFGWSLCLRYLSELSIFLWVLFRCYIKLAVLNAALLVPPWKILASQTLRVPAGLLLFSTCKYFHTADILSCCRVILFVLFVALVSFTAREEQQWINFSLCSRSQSGSVKKWLGRLQSQSQRSDWDIPSLYRSNVFSIRAPALTYSVFQQRSTTVGSAVALVHHSHKIVCVVVSVYNSWGAGFHFLWKPLTLAHKCVCVCVCVCVCASKHV